MRRAVGALLFALGSAGMTAPVRKTSKGRLMRRFVAFSLTLIVASGVAAAGLVGSAVAASLSAPRTIHVGQQISVRASGVSPGRYGLYLLMTTAVQAGAGEPIDCVARVGRIVSVRSSAATLSGRVPSRLVCRIHAGRSLGSIKVSKGSYRLFVGCPIRPGVFSGQCSYGTRRVRVTEPAQSVAAASVRRPLPGLPTGFGDGKQLVVRPAEIVYTGDSSGGLGGFDGTGRHGHFGHLHWSQWTPTRAVGSGAVWANDCSCATGRFSPSAVAVRASAPKRGHFTVLTLRYRYHGKRVIDRRTVVWNGSFYEYH